MRKFAALPLITGVLLASGVGLIAAGGPAQAAGCNAFGNGPYKSGPNLRGSAGQSGTCSGYTVNTALRRDLQFSPDPTLATSSGSGSVTLTMTSASCVGGNAYYTQASSSSGSYAESGRTLPC